MADPDYITLDPGANGEKVATDNVGGIHRQRVKIDYGATGTAIPVSTDSPLPVRQMVEGTQNMPLMRFLDVVGDGSGAKNANGDYSSVQGIFRLAPAASTVYRVALLNIMIEDTAGLAAETYGAISGGITNGVQLRIHNGTSTVLDLLDEEPIKLNSQWLGVCPGAEVNAWGSVNEILTARWDLKAAGMFLRLDGDASAELQIVLDDDLTGLISHRFFVQGYIEGTVT